MRRSAAWDTCSAMPASPPPSSNPSSRSTPSPRPAATGCSPRPPAAPAPTAPPSSTPCTPSAEQHPQLQVAALTAAGCDRVFTETASGARTDRPTLIQLLDQLRPGDTLVVWKLDRLPPRAAAPAG